MNTERGNTDKPLSSACMALGSLLPSTIVLGIWVWHGTRPRRGLRLLHSRLTALGHFPVYVNVLKHVHLVPV